jgi:hypothetical protein
LESLCRRCHNVAHDTPLTARNGRERFTNPERW